MLTACRSWLLASSVAILSMIAAIAGAQDRVGEGTYGITAPGSAIYPNGGMVRAGFLQLPSGWNQAFATAVDGFASYAYLASDTNPGYVYKMNVYSMQPVARLELAAGETNLRCIMIDAADEFAYVGTFTDPPRVVKINLRDFSRVGSIQITGASGGIQSGAYSREQNCCYFATWNSPMQVYRVDLATFTVTGAVSPSGSTFPNEARLRPLGDQMFFGCNLTSGQIARVRLSNFGALTSFSALASENSIRSLEFDTSGTLLYASTSADPAHVIKFNAQTGARIAAATLAAGEAEAYLTLVDRADAHVYAGTSTAPAHLVKVRTDTMARETSLPMAPANHLRSGALVDDRHTILASGYGFPSTVTKVSTTPRRSMRATKVTIPERTYLKRMGFHQHAPAPARLAIYRDSIPYQLAWQSELLESDVVEGVVHADSDDGRTLLEPGDYWLVWQCDSDEPVASYVPGATDSGWAASIAHFTGFPVVVYPEMATKNSQNWSIFVETGRLSGAPEWTAYE